jgi:hypothetical protein
MRNKQRARKGSFVLERSKHTNVIMSSFGVWRSLVAHLHGVQGVASSNLVTPTKHNKANSLGLAFFIGRFASLVVSIGAAVG